MCKKNVRECLTRCNQQNNCKEGNNRIAWQQKAIDHEKHLETNMGVPVEVLLNLNQIYEC